MDWSRSKLIVLLALSLLAAPAFAEAPVKPDVWDELRKEHTYNEEPTEPLPQMREKPAPLGLGIWWEMLRLVLLIGLLIGIIYLVVRLTSKGGIYRKAPVTNLAGDAPTALSPKEAIETALERSLAAGDYREAIRLWYQMALKTLIAKKVIRPEKDKTNWEYVAELKSGNYFKPFTDLTRYHEKVWYAGNSIDREAYELHVQKFNNFFALTKE